jgi:DNA-binding MarR family transcriptional regulator
MPTPWLDANELAAWRSFTLMHLQLMARLSRELNATGVSLPDYLVMATLSDAPGGRRRMSDVGDELGWEKSRTSHHVTRMCERGLVEKQPCESDQRGAYVALTDLGRREARRVAPSHVRAVRELFIDRLSRDELAMLSELSDRVLDGLGDAALVG